MTTDSGTSVSRSIPVAILGCTGVVGQKFIALLQGHPYFRIVSLCASERSAGQQYGSVVSWKLPAAIPGVAASLTVTTCDVASVRRTEAEVVFSALDASVAGRQATAADKQPVNHTASQPPCQLTSPLVYVCI